MQVSYFDSLYDNGYFAHTMECITHLQPSIVMVFFGEYYLPHTEQLDRIYGFKCLYPDKLRS